MRELLAELEAVADRYDAVIERLRKLEEAGAAQFVVGYPDAQLCELLDVRPSTLYQIRKRGLIKSGFKYPGSREHLTTPEQLAAYREYLNSPAAARDERARGARGTADERAEDARLDELSVHRRARRRQVA